ncbi:MAG: F0F1 ATP synthase subunit B [Chloroflexi bacterium]|nr:F0F1 ATP synthase subunit B [Chloroflexota bacterium]
MEGLSELGINGASLLAQLVNFGILLVLLYLIAYKPILRIIDQRSEKVKESLAQTEDVKLQAEQAEQEIKGKLEQVSKQSQEVIDRAAKTGEEIRQRAMEEAKEEAKALVTRARVEIKRESDEVIEQLRREYADLTVLAAEKIIDKSLDKNAHKDLIDKVMDESAGFSNS